MKKTEKAIAAYEESSAAVSPDNAIGRISRMDAINNKSVTETALRNAWDKLNKLNYTLTKIGSPDFGMCVRCGREIPLGRILIKPESVYCVHCAD